MVCSGNFDRKTKKKKKRETHRTKEYIYIDLYIYLELFPLFSLENGFTSFRASFR